MSPTLTETEARVAAIMTSPERALSFDEIKPDTSMSHDARIDGIDIDDFAHDMHQEFGAIVYEIPWLRFSDQRASFRGCGCLMLPFWLVWRLIVRASGEPMLPPPNGGDERLTVRHIARVIDQGFWSEPTDTK
jgi:hypothetical protein